MTTQATTQTTAEMTDEAEVRQYSAVRRRAARVITELFAPAVWAAAMPLVVAVHSTDDVITGLGWAALVITFSSVIPFSLILWGVRRGRLTDHHIGRREQRRGPLLFGLVSVVVGLVLVWVLHGPRQLVAMVAVMLVVLLGATLVNQVWKLSAHTAVCAGSIAVLVLIYGPGMLAGVLLVAAVGWSRVVLRDHTTAQVFAGTGLGAVLATGVFQAMG